MNYAKQLPTLDLRTLRYRVAYSVMFRRDSEGFFVEIFTRDGDGVDIIGLELDEAQGLGRMLSDFAMQARAIEAAESEVKEEQEGNRRLRSK